MFYKIIATVFFIGYFPFAPGTVASVFAMAVLWLFKLSDRVVLFMLIVFFILGVLASEKIEKKLEKKDPSCIVIDEFTGYLTAVAFFTLNWQVLVAGFILFRFFDILKPPPIRQIERKLRGGLGIMIDDMIAGLMANLSLRILLML
mgnify:CR=1 FL=1